MSKIRFESEFPNLNDKKDFLDSFNLINLQKAGKIGNISLKKMEKKSDAIKSILKFDIKHKFLICKTMFNNPNEYEKEKIDDSYALRTIELNQYQFDNMKTKDWNMLKNELTQEIDKFKEQVNSGEIEVSNNFDKPQDVDYQVKNENDLNKQADTDSNIIFKPHNVKSVSLNKETQIKRNSSTSKNKEFDVLFNESINKANEAIKNFNNIKNNKEINEELRDEAIEQYHTNLRKLHNIQRLEKLGKNRKGVTYNKKDTFVNIKKDNDQNHKFKIKNEIDKMKLIDSFEYFCDSNTNKKILIVKGK